MIGLRPSQKKELTTRYEEVKVSLDRKVNEISPEKNLKRGEDEDGTVQAALQTLDKEPFYAALRLLKRYEV